MNYYLAVLKKYAVFSGRAKRAEYWMFVLFNMIISFVLREAAYFVKSDTVFLVLYGLLALYGLIILIPSFAVFVRRLHDTGRSGWWFFIIFVPLAGPVILFVFMVLDSTPGENKYGPNPKGVGINKAPESAPTGL